MMTCSMGVCYDNLIPPQSQQSDFYSDTDMGRAMRICESHIRYSTTITIPSPRLPDFTDGWEACAKVWSAWLESEDARKQREYEAEIARQKSFVEEVARSLK